MGFLVLLSSETNGWGKLTYIAQAVSACLRTTEIIQSCSVTYRTLKTSFRRAQTCVKLLSNLWQSCVKVVSQLFQVMSMEFPIDSPVLSMQFSNSAKWSPSCPKWYPSVVHVVPNSKWCQVVPVYVNMWPRNVLSEGLWSCCRTTCYVLLLLSTSVIWKSGVGGGGGLLIGHGGYRSSLQS